MASRQTVYILQGVPGSGKSFVATRLLLGSRRAAIVSADDFFVEDDGVYRFNPLLIRDAHAFAQDKARRALEAGCSVIVDNTNITTEEARPYVRMALNAGAAVQFLRCTGSFANAHGVPEGVVRNMARSMQHLSVESVMAGPCLTEAGREFLHPEYHL